ncbi:hypothetical protein QBC32DRAFT_355364 [Pseudoneurospora amorphoporcata]|uniref:Uncharacterized protein n=1 Tax=Pseudoneurospora amorphoporcata TaxID=241081 RepID=A0AAN6NL63_9PEZI|nr:hypothetical protein QBC32DRAFT_355364 [Pseudoneurospora amorphoporcata]
MFNIQRHNHKNRNNHNHHMPQQHHPTQQPSGPPGPHPNPWISHSSSAQPQAQGPNLLAPSSGVSKWAASVCWAWDRDRCDSGPPGTHASFGVSTSSVDTDPTQFVPAGAQSHYVVAQPASLRPRASLPINWGRVSGQRP